MINARNTIRVDVADGVSFEIDPASLKTGPKLRPAFEKLLRTGRASGADRAALAKKKALLGAGPQALIIRFDVTVIRIDEKAPLDLAKLSAVRAKKKSARRK